MNSDKKCINVDIENLRISITLYGGFFSHDIIHSSLHSHNSYEFHIMRQGESVLEFNSEKVELERAQACIVAPNIFHTCVSKAEKHIKITFCFSFEKLNRKTEKDVYKFFSSAFEKIDGIKKINNGDHYFDRLDRILSDFYSRKVFLGKRLQMEFSLLMFSILDDVLETIDIVDEESQRSYSSETGDSTMRKIIIEDYINQNYLSDINIKTLSERLYLSEKQTERVFRQETGMRFKSFVRKQRVETAMYYLDNTDLPIGEIATKVGYQSYDGFYRLFLEYTGQTPMEYRNRDKLCNLTKIHRH